MPAKSKLIYHESGNSDHTPEILSLNNESQKILEQILDIHKHWRQSSVAAVYRLVKEQDTLDFDTSFGIDEWVFFTESLQQFFFLPEHQNAFCSTFKQVDSKKLWQMLTMLIEFISDVYYDGTQAELQLYELKYRKPELTLEQAHNRHANLQHDLNVLKAKSQCPKWYSHAGN